MPKISQLPTATAVNATDKVVIVQGGVTKQADASLVSGGGGGTTPTGTGFRHVTSGTEDAASAKVDLTASADVTVPAAGVVTSDGTVLASTSTLVHERGGLEADVSAYSGLVKISGGATSAVALGTGVETFLGTPSGANLASALTSGLPTSKGGTGLTTAVVRFATSAISGTSNHDVDLGIVSGEVCIVYLTDTGAVTVTGIVPPTGGGSAVLILRKGTAQLTLTNESASSTAANRLTIGGTAASFGWVLVYNTSTARWEMAAYPAYEA